MINMIYYQRLGKEDEIWREGLKNVIPPIKGEITKGKLKWRGVKIIVQNGKKYLIQRGKIISDIYEI